MKSKWTFKNLGDVCHVIGGGTPSKDRPDFYGGDIPWATIRDMRQDLITETEHRITQDALKNSASNVIPEGNVVIATRVGLGKVSMVAQGTAINQDLRGIVPIDRRSMDPRFLFWWAKNVSPLIVKAGTGATVQGVKVPFVKSLKIPVLPISEQRRIVGILDEAFDGLATAKANAERNLQNARALFESHLDATFGTSGNGWLSSTLEEVVDASCTLSYGIVQPGDECSDGLPIVRPTDLTTKLITLDGLKRIKPELANGYKRTALHGGELLLCVRGSTGVISIAAAELLGANVTRGIVPIRFDSSRVFQNFGYYLMNSGLVQEQIREKTYGTALMQINIGDLREIRISFPSIKEQARIAAALDVIAKETQRLESVYQSKLAALDELKQSLLHQAFSGAL